MKEKRIWILVADGGNARILEAVGDWQGLHEVPGTEIRQHNPPSHLLGKAKPGRVFESVGGTRHAVEPKQDPHKAAEARFAAQLAGHLQQHVETNAFDKLVIVAPPVMLGYLRKYLTNDVAAKLIAEVDKDLAKVPNNEVASHLKTVIAL